MSKYANSTIAVICTSCPSNSVFKGYGVRPPFHEYRKSLRVTALAITVNLFKCVISVHDVGTES